MNVPTLTGHMMRRILARNRRHKMVSVTSLRSYRCDLVLVMIVRGDHAFDRVVMVRRTRMIGLIVNERTRPR